MSMRIALFASVAALLLTTPAWTASQKNWNECADTSADPERNIAACTVILSGIESPRNHASALQQTRRRLL
jgi:hypothetical protein